MHVALVEPWCAGSHAAWADALVRHSRHRVSLVSHEGRSWRWRMRGGAVTLAAELERVVGEQGRPDVLVVSGMVNLPALLGLSRRFLGDPPVLLYLHENQIVEDVGPSARREEGLGAIDWVNLVAADAVRVNSAFHRDALVAALPSWVARVPDRPHTALLDAVIERIDVLHPPVELTDLIDAERADGAGGPPLVLWNQRWDHDKEPEALFRVLAKLAEHDVPFRVALAGENRRMDPQEFDRLCARLGDRVVHVGWLPTEAYRSLLRTADVVVSTARHEFFGIALIEAMAAGAVPLLPDRLAFPEVVLPEHHDAVLYRSHLYDRLRSVLEDVDGARRAVPGLRGSMARFDARVVVPAYDDLFEALAAGYRPAPC